jgi:hypothetical protein
VLPKAPPDFLPPEWTQADLKELGRRPGSSAVLSEWPDDVVYPLD